MMEEKLEKLAESRRRLSSPYPSLEMDDADLMLKALSLHEKEDRKSGVFPYDENQNSVQSVSHFYAGKNILITGGTGFVGKVLIEKILRSLPDGGRIYLLLRGKKGLSPQQRIQAMLKLPIFELVMTENPKAAERLVAIEGDCSSLGLGLSQADRCTIIENVSIVFHCAATVNFNLPFTYVAMVNTRGTREMVYLCKDLKKLDAFVHISTAYTASAMAEPILEEVPDTDVDWRTVIAAAEKSLKSSKDDGFDLIFEKLQTKQPNNYTFTKLLAEVLVEEECKDMPVIIVRPSVLMPSYEDPFGGWVDNVYGPLSFQNGIGRGILRVAYVNKRVSLDHLPIDFHIKTLIVAAWHRGLGFRLRSDPQKTDVVNNCSISYLNEPFGKQRRWTPFIASQVTHRYVFRYPRYVLTNNFWLFWFVTMTSHVPFGILMDTILRLKGQKPMYVLQLLRAYRGIFLAQSRYLHYFGTRQFRFVDKSQWVLDARIPKQDKTRFSVASKLFVMSYAVDCMSGVIQYVFKEKPVKSEESNQRTMYIVDWIQNILLAVLGCWMIYWMILG